MNDVSTAPTPKTKMPKNKISCENIAVNPAVNVGLVPDVKPIPSLELKSSKNSVDATLPVRLMTVRLVWSFLRNRSLTGKKVSLIVGRQFAIPEAEFLVCKLQQLHVVG